MLRSWIKPRAPLYFLFLIVALALFSYLLFSSAQKKEKKGSYQEMVEASSIMAKAMDHLYQARIKKGLPYEEELDPNRTGLIGLEYTALTTTYGSLEAKRTATNPLMAALMVEYFVKAGLREGDVVAIGASGSFPSLLLACLGACKALHLSPLIIYSLGSSTYGANIVGFTMIEMLEELRKRKIFPETYDILAVSLGGGGDTGEGLLGREEAKRWLEEGPYPFIYEEDLEKNRSKRIEIYGEHSPKESIAIYVNIGGGVASFGASPLSLSLRGGLLLENPLLKEGDGLIFYYLSQGIPVIHLIHIRQIAEEEGLDVDPIPLPKPGEGEIFYQISYPSSLGALFLILLLGSILFCHLYYGRRS